MVVDHLIVDRRRADVGGIEAWVESGIRRAIIGQLLEYAAHAANTWTAEELREAFERRTEAKGLNPRDELAKLLLSDGDPPVDEFWKRVSTNLSANRLRLLFVADDIIRWHGWLDQRRWSRCSGLKRTDTRTRSLAGEPRGQVEPGPAGSPANPFWKALRCARAGCCRTPWMSIGRALPTGTRMG